MIFFHFVILVGILLNGRIDKYAFAQIRLIVSDKREIKKFNQEKSSFHGITNEGCYLFKNDIIKVIT
ncbi:hypothetical protein HA149_07035 [Prochlorococcus marinus XMU1406]|uniref:hypothetical protein n=1 Tax=Prochlorococcus marinus TaxID=1219 RepID=UPI001ADCD3FE|nr:hypothetical protein [Prochlorococcus marinus]MBO8206811.1 hypothetical protein [Prochlorococcus marinus XMU1406]MCR8542630.1 hypothetical protein [Prochlorococcus marinus XMU1427]